MNKAKLELTWVGKDKRPRLEPRVLVEDPTRSHGDPKAENMLIFGDNLLALKALEQDFAGKIKCIYPAPERHGRQPVGVPPFGGIRPLVEMGLRRRRPPA